MWKLFAISGKKPYNSKNGIQQIYNTHWRQFRTLPYNRLKNIADQQEINEEWENIKTAITESAKETIKL